MEREEPQFHSGIGRPAVDVWQEYRVVVARWSTPKKQHPDVECRHCDKIIRHAQHKKNLYPHLERCTKVPSDVRANSTSKRRRESSDKVTTPSKRARITARNEIIEPISLTEKKEFHLEVARAFFIRVIENREMRCILTKYWTGMSLPTRQELATPLFDRVYADELANVMEVLKEHQHRCGDRQHTGEYMASALRKAIQEVEEVTGKGSVCGVVTDNASNMSKAWELLMEKIPHLACHGCAAHTINLLL
ncbi:LOW QUALITY PROTEIN: hypothetical protein PHMEG_00024461 [Phytophthora megakarya]|uniref:DUF659 domain-containing protein n=1 Tax=Phytophthora megakarya TaxID=4795 RepID=A0A225VDN6_9STRA|nr:LOW QUALITY PROTEIN: hypothetical protein PHMEG_00024461 [Phytophthora megakarya]